MRRTRTWAGRLADWAITGHNKRPGSSKLTKNHQPRYAARTPPQGERFRPEGPDQVPMNY
ncbi:unnamed protein product, partial [Nesidiocoris tenuis]